MSSSSGYTWGQVVNEFIQGLESILYYIGQFIVNNASTIAEILVGIGILYFVVRYIGRLGFVRNLLSYIL